MQPIKTLGARWNPATDCLHYSVAEWTTPNTLNKRLVASDIAKLFDPLGLLGPIIIVAKMFLQSLWRLKIGWDTHLPAEQTKKWLEYRNSIKDLNNIAIPRHAIIDNWQSIEIHVFCDAFEVAYGTSVYLRSKDKSGKIVSTLLCAKSRVAPLKHTSISRLELCAAVLGARLMERVKQALRDTKITNITMWSDSMVVLGWIYADASSRAWKSFVANRVAEIHDLTDGCRWLHVRTHDNPADLISRGDCRRVSRHDVVGKGTDLVITTGKRVAKHRSTSTREKSP